MASSARQVSKIFPNGQAAARDHHARDRRRRAAGAGGTVGQRQEHRAPADRRARDADHRADLIGDRDVTTVGATGSGSRDGVPELRAVPAQDRAGEPGVRVARPATSRRAHRRARRAQTAAALGIEALLDRKPAQLSGGQRQRVALGRAIVREPQAFLFDEPLSNLDPQLRVETRTELALLHRRLGATMVYVTHDQEEAMTLGTRVAVMRDGAIEQLAPPLDLFRQPANAFVAGFIGSPAMNLIHGTTGRGSRGLRIASPAFVIDDIGGADDSSRAWSSSEADSRGAHRQVLLGCARTISS